MGEGETEGSSDKLRMLQGLIPSFKTKITHLTSSFFSSCLQNVITNLPLADKNEVPLQTLLFGDTVILITL